MGLKFKKLEIPELILIIPEIKEDQRGYFIETYKLSEFLKNHIQFQFVQENHSFSKKGVIRGLHYQLKPKEQAKLIRCIRGRIKDVAVDIRKKSPYYKKFITVELSEENRMMLFIPPGFAHGFLALEDSEVLYKLSEEYDPNFERGIIYNDPEINIPWNIEYPILSERDKNNPPLNEAENNF